MTCQSEVFTFETVQTVQQSDFVSDYSHGQSPHRHSKPVIPCLHVTCGHELSPDSAVSLI